MSAGNKTLKSLQVEYDPDASQLAWDECYKKIYNANNWDFWSSFNYENLKKTYNKVRRLYSSEIPLSNR